jgi:mRNA-degrading endonuclease RelE of RelBE toxin-antitoxin system
MKSRTTKRFRKCLEQLPHHVQDRAKEAYERWKENPSHPGLRFKKVHSSRPIYSVRVSRDYRVLGVRRGESMIWFWIGPHDEYERIIGDL